MLVLNARVLPAPEVVCPTLDNVEAIDDYSSNKLAIVLIFEP